MAPVTIGIALRTRFVLWCSGWKDEGNADAALTYKFYKVAGDGWKELVYSGSTPQSAGLFMTGGNATDGHYVTILAEVYDIFGAFNESTFRMKVNTLYT